MINLYITSNVRHQLKWRRIHELHMLGSKVVVAASWVFNDKIGDDRRLRDNYLAEAWEANIIEITTSHLMLIYHEPGDTLRGALVEVGAALCAKIPVIACSEAVEDRLSPFSTWQYHPLVTRVKEFSDIPLAITKLMA